MTPTTAAHLLPLAGRTRAELDHSAHEFLSVLASVDDRSPGPLCAEAFAAVDPAAPHRIAVTGHSAAELAERLSAHLAGGRVRGVASGTATERPIRLAFLCSGQGAQFTGMGMDLYRTEPAYRDAFDRCASAAAPYVATPLTQLLEPGAGPPSGELHHLPYAALTTFAVGCGLAALWRERGVVPDALMGFSSGEYLAAHLSGALTLRDAVRMLLAETTLAARVDSGAMAVAATGETFVRSVLAGLGEEAPRVDVAAVLSSREVSISGAAAELAVAVERLTELGVRTSALPVRQGLHSPLQEPSLGELRAAVSDVRTSSPRVGMVSTVTGEVADRRRLGDPSHWSAHMRGPVHFDAGVRALDALGAAAFLEIGPGRALTGLGPRCLPDADKLWVASIGRSEDGAEAMLRGLGRLFIAGVPIRL